MADLTGTTRTAGRVVALSVLAAGLAAGSGAFGSVADRQQRPPDSRRSKKLIATGWDHVDSRRLKENLAEMEDRPFDGVVIELTGQIDGDARRLCRLRETFSNRPWQAEWFAPCIEDLRACRFRRFTDNFILLGANPGDVDWFDDAGWAAIVEHWRIAAGIVRQSGFKGVLFDPEPYAPPHAAFQYSAQAVRDRHTFAEYAAQVRLRGRQVMKAIAAECPQMVLFCYFLNIACGPAVGQAGQAGPADVADVEQKLSRMGYGLLPAFLDGWLDEAPPTVTFVDGCEWAYRYNSVEEYLEAALLIKGACQELVSPANRARYRAQVQAGFGIYLDAYWNPPTSPWYIDGKGGPRVERLRANAAAALRVADEYVWVYGEKFRWWPTPNKGVKPESWPEALPASDAALAFCRDPIAFARQHIAGEHAAGRLVNLTRNGDFGAETAADIDGRQVTWREGRPPAGWSAWQDDKSKGVFSWDRQTDAGAARALPTLPALPSPPSPAAGAASAPAGAARSTTGAAPAGGGRGSARAGGVANGCFLQPHRVEPTQRYAVAAWRKLQGRCDAWLRVRWQTSDGAWTAEAHDRIFTCPRRTGQWDEILGVAEVPQGVGRLVILLGVADQPTSDDVAWFDDVQLYRLP